MQFIAASPRHVARRLLSAIDVSGDFHTTVPLAPFQLAGAARAWSILEARRGVLIADSVGMGKTYIGLALVEAANRLNAKALVLSPASVVRTWRQELGRLGLEARVVSHASLARGRVTGAFGLIVVDEAHAFRNPVTYRYRMLRRITEGARVVLLTATPVNNSLSDLYFQLRICFGDGAFRDLGVGSLREALCATEPRMSDVDRICRAVIVRRTRAQVRSQISGESRFPARVMVEPVVCRMALPLGEIEALLCGLTDDGRDRSAALLRYAILKRIESSNAAGITTLRRLIQFQETAAATVARGRALDVHSFRKFCGFEGDQLLLEELVLAARAPGSRPWRPDIATMRRALARLQSADDAKTAALVALLRTRPPEARTIVFTEFRDTARHLWTELRDRFAIGLVDGGGGWIGASRAGRRAVIERFAPVADRSATPHAREAVRILIATDVLAEGLNLQDADAVVSFDLPWNPVKLIQRAGRVDRIGSAHAEVRVYNFIPDREFDAFLGLARRIRSKLETVRSVVGLERPVLDPEDADIRNDLLDRLEPIPECVVKPGCEVPVAALPGASGRRAIVGLASGAVLQHFIVTPTTVFHADLDSASLATAMKHDEINGPLPDAAALVVERALAAAVTQPATAGMPDDMLAARVARLLRRCMSTVSLLDAADVYARADAILEAVSTADDASLELALATLRTASPSFSGVLGALEKVFSEKKVVPRPPADWRPVAVLFAD